MHTKFSNINCLSSRSQLLSLFSSKVYYKVAPPSEINNFNLSLLSSAPESEIGTNASKCLGSRAVFIVWHRNYPAKITQLSFFDR